MRFRRAENRKKWKLDAPGRLLETQATVDDQNNLGPSFDSGAEEYGGAFDDDDGALLMEEGGGKQVLMDGDRIVGAEEAGAGGGGEGQ